MALHEHSVLDPQFGHVVNHDFAGYHIAANADVGSIDVHCLDEQDAHLNPMRLQGHRRARHRRHRGGGRERRATTPPACASATCPSRSTSCSDPVLGEHRRNQTRALASGNMSTVESSGCGFVQACLTAGLKWLSCRLSDSAGRVPRPTAWAPQWSAKT